MVPKVLRPRISATSEGARNWAFRKAKSPYARSDGWQGRAAVSRLSRGLYPKRRLRKRASRYRRQKSVLEAHAYSLHYDRTGSGWLAPSPSRERADTSRGRSPAWKYVTG